ncbi:MAG: hypothetical protein US66_C0010G0014 [Candidatus Moranbacteria bacterium GW2011_GWD2_37_9]|nr:MAG: hypothetical protein US66_C0010G0014 [Candidatus Moranbacteria bacterium GW2011_GWD2_37_9]
MKNKESTLIFSVIFFFLALALVENVIAQCGTVAAVQVEPTNDNESGTWSNEVSYTPPGDDSVSSGGDPDFKPMELYIDHHRKLLRPGQDHEVFTRIKNKGDASSPEDIQIRYWLSDGYKIDAKDDRISFGTDNIQKENLPPGDSKWESKTNEAPNTPEIYNYTVEADDEDDIEEVKESNNTFDPPYVFEVKKPELYFANAYIVGEQEQYSPGYVFQLKVFTENDGANPGKDVKVYYYMDGVKFGEDNMREYNIEPEDPPKEESIYAVAPMTPGTHTVSAVVDPGDYVDEGNENNNTWSKTFTVVAPDPEPVYDTAVASVSVSNPELSFYPGEIFEISAVAQNLGDNPPSDILMGYFLLGGELSEPLLLGSITITSQDFPSTSIITKSLGNIGAPGLSEIYQIKACINYDERFVEASEENDCRTIEIEVKKEHLNPAVINILD